MRNININYYYYYYYYYYCYYYYYICYSCRYLKCDRVFLCQVV